MIDNEINNKKEFTNNIDFGVSFGTGYSYPFTNRLLLNADLIFNIGLFKIDKKYHNEYEETILPSITGSSIRLRATNYYGLNSNARNLNMGFTVGIAYCII